MAAMGAVRRLLKTPFCTQRLDASAVGSSGIYGFRIKHGGIGHFGGEKSHLFRPKKIWDAPKSTAKIHGF